MLFLFFSVVFCSCLYYAHGCCLACCLSFTVSARLRFWPNVIWNPTPECDECEQWIHACEQMPIYAYDEYALSMYTALLIFCMWFFFICCFAAFVRFLFYYDFVVRCPRCCVCLLVLALLDFLMFDVCVVFTVLAGE